MVHKVPSKQKPELKAKKRQRRLLLLLLPRVSSVCLYIFCFVFVSYSASYAKYERHAPQRLFASGFDAAAAAIANGVEVEGNCCCC